MEDEKHQRDTTMNADGPSTQGDRFPWVTVPVVVLVAANLVPAYGVLFLGWTIYPVVLFFWFENVALGAFTVLKMLLAEPARVLTWLAKFFWIPVFCVHYGLFTLIHGVIVAAIFGGSINDSENVFAAPFRDIRNQGLLLPAMALFVSHGFSFLWNYVGQGEYKTASLHKTMSAPYGRVCVLHVTVLLAAYLVQECKAPMAFLVLLVAAKILVDVWAHLRERRKFRSKETAPAS